MLKIKKRIYDNVHGYIGVTEQELSLIDTSLFQRLRQIKQLGVSDMVYPGATHTRFAHSLGTMYMADQFLSRLKDSTDITEEVVEKVRLAALLHDIGHYPFSHTMEKFITEKLGFLDHVDFGAMIIRRFMRERLRNHSSEEIIRIMHGESKDPIASAIISSSLDADKADYLLRDSYNAGLTQNRIDLPRLLKILSVDGSGRLIFENDEAAIENFLIGRYYMFRVLYHQKASVGLGLLVTRIYGKMIEEGFILPPSRLKSESSIARYTDDFVMEKMHAALKSKRSSKSLKELISAFLTRNPPRLAWSYQRHAKKTPSGYLFVKSLWKQERFKRRLAKLVGLEEDWIFPIALRPIALMDEEIYLKRRDRVYPLSEVRTPILKTFKTLPLYDARIYAKRNGSVSFSDAVKKLRYV